MLVIMLSLPEHIPTITPILFHLSQYFCELCYFYSLTIQFTLLRIHEFFLKTSHIK